MHVFKCFSSEHELLVWLILKKPQMPCVRRSRCSFSFRVQVTETPQKSCDTFRPSPPAPRYITAACSGAKTPLRSHARLYFQQEWEKNVERKEKLNNEPRPCSTHEAPRHLSLTWSLPYLFGLRFGLVPQIRPVPLITSQLKPMPVG